MNMVGTQNQHNRETWIRATLQSLPSRLRILDAGAGEQQYRAYCKHLEYVSQDFAKYEGSGNNKGLQVDRWDCSGLDIVSDIIAIPEPDASFDVILCTEVFEHLPEPILAIKEFRRLLKRNGVLIITAPFCSLTHFAPYHFCSGYNRYFYEKILSENGFEIVELSPNGNYFEYVAQEVRRIQSVAKRYSNDKVSFIEKRVLQLCLKMLERFSKNDRGSQELLCFGYHINAKRK